MRGARVLQRDFDPALLLEAPLMAHLATAHPDGPRDSPLWFLWEAEAVWLVGTAVDSFMRRLQAEPRCALGLTRFEPEQGVLLHLGLRGRATVGPQDPGRFRRLLAKYLGPDEAGWNPWFLGEIARIGAPEGRMARVEVETAVARNLSFFRTGPELAWPEDRS
jgi:hypothetical protein